MLFSPGKSLGAILSLHHHVVNSATSLMLEKVLLNAFSRDETKIKTNKI